MFSHWRCKRKTSMVFINTRRRSPRISLIAANFKNIMGRPKESRIVTGKHRRNDGWILDSRTGSAVRRQIRAVRSDSKANETVNLCRCKIDMRVRFTETDQSKPTFRIRNIEAEVFNINLVIS